jgi:predicted PurR-regulated permease PerM
MKKNITEIEVSWRTLFQIAMFIGAIALMFYVTNLLLLLFLTFTLSAGLNPVIKFLQRKLRIPRVWSILLIVVLFFGFVGSILFFSLQNVLNQTTDLFTDLPTLSYDIIAKLGLKEQLNIDNNEDVVREAQRILGTRNPLSGVGSQALTFSSNLFSGILTLITLAAITFYQLSEPEKVKNFLVSFSNKQNAPKTKEIIEKVEQKLGRWLLGQLTLMLAIGTLSYIGFKLIGIEYALPLALISGVTDIIPVIGPVIGIIPILIVSFATAPVPQAIAVGVYLLVLQQIEGNILVPRIMKKSVGLDPIVVIIAIMLGSQLLGVLGALLAIPISVIINILFSEWQSSRD